MYVCMYVYVWNKGSKNKVKTVKETVKKVSVLSAQFFLYKAAL